MFWMSDANLTHNSKHACKNTKKEVWLKSSELGANIKDKKHVYNIPQRHCDICYCGICNILLLQSSFILPYITPIFTSE